MVSTIGLMAILGVFLESSVARPDTTDVAWCAPPRAEEPLFSDAQFLPSGSDSTWVPLERLSLGIPRLPLDLIGVVKDEAICRKVAALYAAPIRSAFPEWPDVPVLIVRVGDFYLVDDQRPRSGQQAYWEVVIFDRNWNRVSAYGAGA